LTGLGNRAGDRGRPDHRSSLNGSGLNDRRSEDTRRRCCRLCPRRDRDRQSLRGCRRLRGSLSRERRPAVEAEAPRRRVRRAATRARGGSVHVASGTEIEVRCCRSGLGGNIARLRSWRRGWSRSGQDSVAAVTAEPEPRRIVAATSLTAHVGIGFLASRRHRTLARVTIEAAVHAPRTPVRGR